ncbi:hypothetical protein Btru_027178 [Bulinus truncatus]|nr:hypothetical protein Btru_027178 [Bulinus truncatus]
MQPDANSPYMLWQYMHLLKQSDYLLHPAFTHPTTAYTTEQSSCISEHSVSSYNYHRHQHQHPQLLHHPYHRQAGTSSNHLLQNDFGCTKNNMRKINHKLRNDRPGIAYNGHTRHSLSAQTADHTKDIESTNKSSKSVSPFKGSSFTIDAILNKDDKLKIQQDITSTTTNNVVVSVKTEQSSTPLRSSSASPSCSSPIAGQYYGQPLMHSTPCDQERKHDRLYELGQPYLFHQYDSVPSRHNPAYTPTQALGSSNLTSSPLSSLSSLSSVSSTSVSPETNHLSHKGKIERKTCGKPKRIRTIFTPEQLEKLEVEFERQQYMVGTERYYLAAALNLTEAQVKVWFQNRRIKWRKQHLEQQQAKLAQGDLYRDVDNDEEESDSSDTDDKTENRSIELSSRQRFTEGAEISDETGYASS